jgi:prevent-host-death family protein
MRSVPVAEAKAKLSEVIESLDEPVVITRHGQPVAVLMAIPEDQDDMDSFLLAHHPGFRAMVRKAKQSRILTSDEFWDKVGERQKRGSSRRPRRR